MAIVLVPVSFLFNSNLTICHLTRQSSWLFLKNIQHFHYTRSPNRTKETRQSLLKIKYRNYHSLPDRDLEPNLLPWQQQNIHRLVYLFGRNKLGK